jgi:zinc protease
MRAATRERLLGYYRRHYTPENMSVVVVGPVDRARARAAVERTFGRERRTGYRVEPAPPAPALSRRASRDVERPEQQAWLGLAWPAPRADDPAGFAVDLLASILGGTESSRLVQRLRDRERLVSDLKMSYAALVGGGILSLRASLEAGDLPRVEQILLEEVRRVRDEGVTEEERQLAVTRAESDHVFETETSEGLANAYGLAETTWVLEEELRYVERLRAVTRAEIQEAARRFLSPDVYARLAFVPKR